MAVFEFQRKGFNWIYLKCCIDSELQKLVATIVCFWKCFLNRSATQVGLVDVISREMDVVKSDNEAKVHEMENVLLQLSQELRVSEWVSGGIPRNVRTENVSAYSSS